MFYKNYNLYFFNFCRNPKTLKSFAQGGEPPLPRRVLLFC